SKTKNILDSDLPFPPSSPCQNLTHRPFLPSFKMSSSRRISMLPPVHQQGPKAPVKLSSSLTISDSAILTGHHSIVIMSESVVHPRCRLESTTGSLLIGKRCIVHERTHIGAAPAADPEKQGGGIVIGDYV